MADFVAPSYSFAPPPDFFGMALRGMMAPLQMANAQQQLQLGQAQLAMAPGQLQEQGLRLDQLRMMLQNAHMMQNYAQQTLQGGPSPGSASSQGGAQAVGASSGGIQNGPQGSVSSQAPQGAGSPLDTMLDPRRIALNAQFGSIGALLNGGDPNKPLSDAQALMSAQRNDLAQRTKLNLQPAQDSVTTLLGAPNPEQLVMANPSYKKIWDQYAPRLGLNPNDPRSMTSRNVQVAATMFQNEQIAGRSMGTIDPLPVPAHFNQVGVGYGGSQNVNDVTGQTSAGLPRELPTATIKEVTNPDLTTSAVSIPSGGMDAQGRPIALTGPMAAGSGVNLGRGAPSEPEAKAAGFASSMRQGVTTLRQMEGGGYELSPTDRATLINVASDENPGILTQWWKQELLAHKLDPQGQAYLAATMPVIQALSHDQSGARLNSSTIRANLESAIPIDTGNNAAMQQIEGFRDNYYKSMLIGAGKAAYTPAFNNTLGADLRSMAASSANRGTHPANIQALLDKYKR